VAQAADLAQSHPKPAFRLDAVTTYNPPLSVAQQWFAAGQFVLSLGAVSAFLWNVDAMPMGTVAIWVAALFASMWALGLFMQVRLGMLEVLVLEATVLATLASIYLLAYYLWLKPLPMVIAIIFVAARARSVRASGINGIYFEGLLLLALLASLAGDVLLMLPGNYFVPGLGAFLVTHLCYLAMLRQGVGWFPSRKALLAVLGVGAAMYAVVLPGLGAGVLPVAVAAYVLVIALMAAQGIGRATVLGKAVDAGARWVAVGACIFMLSDALIAINKFVMPVPQSGLWILATYFCAQMLIIHHARPVVSRP
jgi:alkylglycerol monooxygenase